jgi:DNA-binding protein H-NS
MPGRIITKMGVEALMALRVQVNALLARRRVELEKQLRELNGASGHAPARVAATHRRASSLKGTKVPPKYRDPKTGQTWSGRGAMASWLAAAVKRGQRLEHFAVNKRVASRKRGLAKRSPRKRA